MMLIAISGNDCVGKSTLAKHIKSIFPDEFAVIDSFAYSLRLAMLELGFEYSDVFLKPTKPNIRKAMMEVGKEMRDKDDLVFVNSLVKRVSEYQAKVVIIDDMRYEVEYFGLWSRFDLFHLHITGGSPNYDTAELRELADLVIPSQNPNL